MRCATRSTEAAAAGAALMGWVVLTDAAATDADVEDATLKCLEDIMGGHAPEDRAARARTARRTDPTRRRSQPGVRPIGHVGGPAASHRPRHGKVRLVSLKPRSSSCPWNG